MYTLKDIQFYACEFQLACNTLLINNIYFVFEEIQVLTI